jgi:micrococcal nuclease
MNNIAYSQNTLGGTFSRLAVIACCAVLLSCSQTAVPDTYYIVRVIDGDTVQLAGGERLRYIGIDTPERDEPFYLEATECNRGLVEGKEIRIEFDLQKRDRYGRLLGYVYADTVFVNAELIKVGLAVLYTFPPNVKYADYFRQLQAQARSKKQGLWSELDQ